LKIPSQIFTSAQPFFLFSEQELANSVKSARKFWQAWSLPGFEIFFSVKSNPNPHVLKVLSRYVDGFDVSSLAEARLIRALGIAGHRITWSGPAKTNRAIEEVLPWGLRCFHLDSFDEWSELRSRARPSETKFSLRLSTPQIHTQKLGLSDLELSKMPIMSAADRWVAVHSYLGRETFSEESLSDFEARLQAKIQQRVFSESPEVYLGAGLPSRLLLESHFASLRPRSPPHRVLHLEAGRGLCQSAGWYGTQVLSRKYNLDQGSAKSIVIIDGGLQHMASHFSSPRFLAEQVAVRFFRDGEELLEREEEVALHGSLSLWHDQMISGILAPSRLRRGDWIVANHVGAYGYSAASNQFLGPSRIREWLLTDKDSSLRDISPLELKPYHLCSAARGTP
jgi:diaminopimelate decarboxylase